MKYALIASPVLAAVALSLSQGCATSDQPTTKTPLLAPAYNARPLTPSSVVVTVDHDVSTNVDVIRINGHNTSTHDIYDKLKTIYYRSQGGVIVEAAQDARFGTVATVVEAALAAGFGRFGLANRAIGSTQEGGLAGFEFIRRPASNDR